MDCAFDKNDKSNLFVGFKDCLVLEEKAVSHIYITFVEFQSPSHCVGSILNSFDFPLYIKVKLSSCCSTASFYTCSKWNNSN